MYDDWAQRTFNVGQRVRIFLQEQDDLSRGKHFRGQVLEVKPCEQGKPPYKALKVGVRGGIPGVWLPAGCSVGQGTPFVPQPSSISVWNSYDNVAESRALCRCCVGACLGGCSALCGVGVVGLQGKVSALGAGYVTSGVFKVPGICAWCRCAGRMERRLK
jgi:hypothetical protein